MISLRSRTTEEGQHNLSIAARLKSLDYTGSISLSGAIFCFLLAVHWAGLDHAWTSFTTIGLLFGFVSLLIVFVFAEWVQESRALLPALTLRREMLWSSLFLFCAYGTISMVSPESLAHGNFALTLSSYYYICLSISKPAKGQLLPSAAFAICH
jgi:hypothetical protein